MHGLFTGFDSDLGRRTVVIASTHTNLPGIVDCRVCRRLLGAGFRVLTYDETLARRGDGDCGLDVFVRESP
jgi:hypothetical protein